LLPPLPITLFFHVFVLRHPLILNLAHSLFTCHPHALPVAWLYSSMGFLLGPYGGQYSQLGKAETKLSNLDAHHFLPGKTLAVLPSTPLVFT